MAQPIIRIDVQMNPNRANQIIGLEQRDVARAVKRTTERLINMAEDDMLVRKYTQTSSPAKPSGSTYIRTFNLKNSVSKSTVSQGVNAKGELRVGASYASDVVGLANQQDPIHAGRWPMLEQVLVKVEINASPVWEQEIRRFIP